MSASLPIDTLKKYKNGFRSFFETGTSEGDTVMTALECDFDEIYSVEKDAEIYRRAQQRFMAHRNVSLFQGSSVDALRLFLPHLTSPTAFFLDAHPDCEVGPSPILEEIDVISTFRYDFMIFADDMRLMGLQKWTAKFSDIEKRLNGMGMTVSLLENDHSPSDLLVAVRLK